MLLSGGMDSTTLLYHVLERGYDVEAVCFDYGQRHVIDLCCAKALTKRKAASVHEGVRLQVPYELTHSSYHGTRPACGVVHAMRAGNE